jgi:hypothetical protein
VSENFLPIKMMHVASTDNPDSDHSDLALFEADMDKVSPEEWAALHLLELDHLTVGYRLLNSGTDLMIPGFPKKVNMVDYDATKIIEQRYIPSGVYDKPTTDAHVHFLSFRELDQVSAIDGMSGSPVIMMKGDGNFHYYSLAGMLIRGDPDTKIGRFVEAGMIVWSLERIMGLR